MDVLEKNAPSGPDALTWLHYFLTGPLYRRQKRPNVKRSITAPGEYKIKEPFRYATIIALYIALKKNENSSACLVYKAADAIQPKASLTSNFALL